QRAADAAARAAVAGLPTPGTAQNNAVAVGGANLVDGSSMTIDSTNDVEFGTWNASNKTFSVLTGVGRSAANAIRVTAHRSAARGTAVPLIFGKVVGQAT